MNTLGFSCCIGTSDNSVPLGLKIILNDQLIYDQAHITSTQTFEHSLPEQDGDNELIFEMYGKTQDHTTVDQAGNILKDAWLTIDRVKFQGIELGELFNKLSQYHHSYNDTQPPTVVRFFGTMGCNGQVKLKFTTPIYLWLLENL